MAKLESIQTNLQYWQIRYAKAEAVIEKYKQIPKTDFGKDPDEVINARDQLILCKLRLMETIGLLNTR